MENASDALGYDARRGTGRDPVAVVGMSCRLPGAADPGRLWTVLAEGADVVTEVPADRFDVDRWYDPRPASPGRIVSRAGGFIDGVAEFDAAFFGLSAHTAVRLDPQQRLLLTLAWEALEDAGVVPGDIAGSRAGVYVGCVSSGYWDVLRGAGLVDLHAAMGVELGGTTAGWLSHLLDLRGPSMGVEAACSTSMLGVHLACRAIWSGEVDTALVGGSNLLLSPDLYFSLSEAEMLSPRGRCRFGEASADGYVRSEGAVVLLLKRLSAAVADGDRVHAVIRGTAAVNNGRGGGTMMTPSAAGQADMLRAACADAGVAPGDLDYVEAHGTGTRIGDHVELTALKEVVGQGRPAGQRCLVGSVKSNLGHTEVAAGLIGLLKTALALRHRTIPATLHVDTPNPLLDGEDVPLELATRRRPWPDRGRPPLAGVSAFGLTGTNVHVVLETAEPTVPSGGTGAAPPVFAADASAGAVRAPTGTAPAGIGTAVPGFAAGASATAPPAEATPTGVGTAVRVEADLGGAVRVEVACARAAALAGIALYGAASAAALAVPASDPVPTDFDTGDLDTGAGYVLPLSARDPGALRRLADRYRELLATVATAGELSDICFTAGARRAHHEHRAAVHGADPRALAEALRAVVEGTPAESAVRSAKAVTEPPRVVFVFPGQGSQWAGMGRELLATDPVFARRFTECADAVRAELGWSPVEVVESGTEPTAVDEVQPVLWAVQVALAAVWRAAGVEPDLVVGHSMGEVAAAVVAGALTVAEGAAVVCRRSVLLAGLAEPGRMWAVQLGERPVRELIGGHAGDVAVGVVNSGRAIVLSGRPGAVEEVVRAARDRGVFCRQVKVDYASHSPLVEPLREHLVAALADLRPRPGDVPVHSTAYGRRVDGTELDGRYWMDNLRLPVRFDAAITAASKGRHDTLFVEISPHPLLVPAIEDGIDGAAEVVGSLRRGEPERAALRSGLAVAYARGCAVDWRTLYPGARFTAPPAYPWSGRHFWAPTGDRAPVATTPTAPPFPEAQRDQVGLPAACSAEELTRLLVRQAAAVLAAEPDDIDPTVPLVAAGLDSLLATRLRRRVEAELNVPIAVGDLLHTRPLADIAADLADRRSRHPGAPAHDACVHPGHSGQVPS
ncbi:acyltransferase domain-containing protein [Actinosynnema sp. NPDC020468]|uniref:type I polyketide synthase n=1 Tax=Actinosynnema sp. NPDC020468 TaxID=3154488 RepID=UPI0034115844